MSETAVKNQSGFWRIEVCVAAETNPVSGVLKSTQHTTTQQQHNTLAL